LSLTSLDFPLCSLKCDSRFRSLNFGWILISACCAPLPLVTRAPPRMSLICCYSSRRLAIDERLDDAVGRRISSTSTQHPGSCCYRSLELLPIHHRQRMRSRPLKEGRCLNLSSCGMALSYQRRIALVYPPSTLPPSFVHLSDRARATIRRTHPAPFTARPSILSAFGTAASSTATAIPPPHPLLQTTNHNAAPTTTAAPARVDTHPICFLPRRSVLGRRPRAGDDGWERAEDCATMDQALIDLWPCG
ncbi:hypothetical protein C8R45DRAFT_1185329, partial [Mycena sanguinolenta]